MYKIITDSTADLPVEYMEEHSIGCMHLSCIIGDKIYGRHNMLGSKEFYDMMKNGAKPTTSQVNPDEAREYFLEYMKESKDMLYIGFSSGLSGTVSSVRIAAEELMEEDPSLNIRVIDTLEASLGEGLIVYKAVNMRAEGKSMDEVGDWIEKYKQNFVASFTVDNLFDLWRGGRVSKTSAFVGTLASIKPRMFVDTEGKLIVNSKIRGRKKSLEALVDYMEEKMGSFKDANHDLITIGHGDVLEDAEYVRDLIKERFGFQNFMINSIGPVIGSHTGPSIVALFFMGDEK